MSGPLDKAGASQEARRGRNVVSITRYQSVVAGLLALAICITSRPVAATTPTPHLVGVGIDTQMAYGPERCRRLSGIGSPALGGFATEAYAVETKWFVDGILYRDSPSAAVIAAPLRDFTLNGPEPKTIVLPDALGYSAFGDTWHWSAPSVPGLTIHISLPDPLRQGTAYDGDANPLARQPFNDAQRALLAHLVGESVAVLPQVALASLPPAVHLVLLDNLYSTGISGEEVAMTSSYPEHYASDDRYAVLLNVANGWGVPIEGGHFFDSDPYGGLDYHREVRFEELLLHEFAHLIDDFYRITMGVYWVDDGGTTNDGWRPNPVARWWEFRQLERENTQEFVTNYAATNVQENFAETFVAWAALRSGRLNPYRYIGNESCTVPDHINSKMPLELEWWDRQGTSALFSVDGALFECKPYLDTDFDGVALVDQRPEGEEPAPMPCSDLVERLR